ncbi:hypothetical protein SLS53_008454 [Cytospora paraplurivora]|uniref:Uncharacterized protein n=1 Tax=Cytospora paraplurivora TaxID=2898453 RepID=A0AAN9YBD2_9PEZI
MVCEIYQCASEHKFEEDNADDEDDSDEADGNTNMEESETTNRKASTKLNWASHAASNLVKAATQHMGLSRAAGAALAIAAVHQTYPEDAFRLLAATAANANLHTQELKNQRRLWFAIILLISVSRDSKESQLQIV